ncbi:BA14K family protein [Xanthobacter sp. KR7-65]|uniref:BA14K family protein n=1 Tax=Xanthobacter sp. KR7-65 TaxID=3156612 RepID=UPI0032B3655A
MPNTNGTIFKRTTIAATTAALIATSFTFAPAASAQGLRAGVAPMASAAQGADEVQYRHGPRRGPGWGRPGVRPGAPRYHARWGRPYWRNGGWYYRNNNNGAWIAAGIAGLALGAAAGAAAANSGGNDAVSYCMQRFQSYDPRSGTYLGYDGLRHPCP